jgi:uncharacterized protein (TIGR02301 family)
MKRGGFVLALAWLATPALAQPPAAPTSSPQQRQRVVDLAYVLGEAHALHRVCAGREDNTWRGRMGRLLQAEAPDPAYRQQLMDSFNAGFTARNAEFPACTIKSADAEKTVAAHGRDLARRIAAGAPP